MPLIENLQTGAKFYESRDIARSYAGDPRYRITFVTPQIRAVGDRVQEVSQISAEPTELNRFLREEARRKKAERASRRTSPGFSVPAELTSIVTARRLRRGA